ncbi:hypothetical protein P344_02250 [Spiroplasma mirum ATCC 29335]|uniref:Uncharacterized protein n=1 Tax=Spiroplasma mirum ATCC 29335 TaxID=838561 RepID=W0GP27_9MOLU|nr:MULTISPECIES: type IV secretory system conjugative DNA transfer family protein [Spiroplasma]AHF60823.1 TraG family protein [Spiroplasma mirum ATCC 29335]AHI57798.1 hypothetical protein P344_02250 [Spiroplasma mirum ATCC 29335]AKM52934.1 conjugal transfer protein TraG [Spiroplasma atrichopogonis]
MKEWFKKRKWMILFLSIGLWVFIFIMLLGYAVFYDLAHNKTVNFKDIEQILTTNQNNFLTIYGAIVGGVYLIFALFLLIFKYHIRYEFVGKTHDKTYGSAEWLSVKHLNKNYDLVNLMHAGDKYGVVANSFTGKNKNFMANIRKETHTMVVAGTRSGKTQGVVIPTLQLFAQSDIKPGVIISDPKGELFETNSKVFADNGYRVLKLDLRSPELSVGWNPLTLIYQAWVTGCELERKYKDSNGMDQESSKYYYWQQKAQDYLSDICTTLYPWSDPKDRFWQESASGAVKGILLAILYDMRENNSFDEKKFNLASVIPIINNKDKLFNYFKKLDISHPARIAISGLLDGAKETTGSILQSIKTGLEKFSDPILRTLISKNELDLQTLTNCPTAVFLVVPDDRTDRHIFASLFISQSYKILIEQASLANRKLEKPFYYILDEFANIPKIPDMGAKISVSGGRNIWWVLIIQDKPQLVDKYGENMARTINNNCSMHIFLQTMDIETAKYYSEIIGERTIVSKSRSNQVLLEKKQASGTRSLSGVSLIKPADLMQLPSGHAVVVYSKEKPLKAKLMPMWKSPCYAMGKVADQESVPLTDEIFGKDYVYILSAENDDASSDSGGRGANQTMELLLEKEKLIKVEGKAIEIEEILINEEIDPRILKSLTEKIEEIYDLTK